MLTNIGAAKLAKATALGTKVEITQLAVGDGNGVLPAPNPAQTALVHELRRAPLNMLTVDPANASQIIAEQVIPEDVGGWWIREIGLFDKDGDMVAIANCAETYKPQLQEGSGRVQVIRVILIVSSTEAVTLKIDPAVVLATRQYVDSQLRAHEQSRNHPDASTTEKGFVQLSSSVTSDSESQAATPKAVKIAMDNGSARLAKDRNLSDLPNTALARQNLELGDSSTRNVGTTAGTVASGDDARITGAMQKSQNGADIPDVAKFLQNLGLGDGSALPVGVPVPWPLATPPTGFLKMNGAIFDKVANPKLALAYPSGVLPDMRAQTIRGWDDGRGIDTGRTLLSEQGDAIRNITGSVANVYTADPNTASGVLSYAGSGFGQWQSGAGVNLNYRNLVLNAANQVPTAAENRVKNVAFNYIVRAQ
nr:phage tail protein [Enterobacter roggenkampii]